MQAFKACIFASDSEFCYGVNEYWSIQIVIFCKIGKAVKVNILPPFIKKKKKKKIKPNSHPKYFGIYHS